MSQKRKPIAKAVQLEIFRRDGWICRWCGRPVIFGPAIRLLELEANRVAVPPVTYYHAHWTRRHSPLLDELGAVLDHIDALAAGGEDSPANLCTACNKCNGRKSNRATTDWEARDKRAPIKGRYGDPDGWDGFTSVFVSLSQANRAQLNSGERAWLKVLMAPM